MGGEVKLEGATVAGNITLQFRHKVARLVEKYELFGINIRLADTAEGVESYQAAPVLTEDRKLRSMRKRYDCSGPPGVSKKQNVLGLGGYENHTPYSYMGKKFQYVTENRGWVPEYVVINDER